MRAAARMNAAAGIAAVAVVFALLALTPGAGRAAGSGALEAVFGTVLGVSAGGAGGTLWLATDDGVVALGLGAGTRLESAWDGLPVREVKEGDRVVAAGARGAGGALVGVGVLVQPRGVGPAYRHVVGVVVEAGDGWATVLDRAGNTVTVDWPAGLVVPAAGEMVTVVVKADLRSNRLAASFVERAADTVGRLERALGEAASPAGRQEIRGLIEENIVRHLAALGEAMGGAGGGADEAIAAALGRVGAGYAQTAGSTGARVPATVDVGTIAGFSGGVLSVRNSVTGAERRFTVTEATEVRAADGDGEGAGLLMRPGRVVVTVDRGSPGGQGAGEPLPAGSIVVSRVELPGVVAAVVGGEGPGIFHGSITAVELGPHMPDADAVVILADQAVGRKVAAKVTAGTRIVLDGRSVSVEGLAAGQQAEVRLGEDGVTALEIGATVATRAERRVGGVVRGLDSDGRYILVQPVRGETLGLRVPAGVPITRDGLKAGLSDVRVEDFVLEASRFDAETGLVTRLVVRSPDAAQVAGMIVGINARAGQVTVLDRNGVTATVQVTDETQVRDPEGRVVALEGLRLSHSVVAGGFGRVAEEGVGNVAGYLSVGVSETATVRGVVALLDEVHAGAGRVVIDRVGGEGPVKLFVADPASRVEVSKNGRRVEGLEGVAVGDVVESAVYDVRTGELSKLAVVTPGAERMRGIVVSVDVGAGALAVLGPDGRTIEMAAGDGAGVRLNGRDVDSLSGIEPGDTVTAALYVVDAAGPKSVLALDVLSGRGALAAARTTGEGVIGAEGAGAARAPVETAFSGVIESIEDGKWVIGGREFLVTDQTQFFGEEPERGLVAKAALRAGEDGVFAALAVSVAGRPSVNPERRPINVRPGRDGGGEGAIVLTGVLSAIAEGAWAIDGVEFRVTEATAILGEPLEGREARATLRLEPDGTRVAVEVVPVRAPEAEGP